LSHFYFKYLHTFFLPLALGLFIALTLFDTGLMRFVIPDLRAIIPPLAVRVFLKLALLLMLTGALHAAGLALTCPLRGP
jgi:hypothetical protein